MAPEEEVLLKGRLLKEVLKEGDGQCPASGERVSVHYVCKLVGSEEVVDSTYARGYELPFTLGHCEVIPGLEQGVASMRCGEKARLTVHPELAYGFAGFLGGVVPPAASEEEAGASMPAASLLYEVELLHVGLAETGSEEELSPEERLQRAMRAKDTGNGHFKSGDFSQAGEAYATALKLLGYAGPKRDAEEVAREEEVVWADSARREARNKLLLSCCLNLAQCELKQQCYVDAMEHASAAATLDPSSSKAHYRKGLAALSIGLLDQAKVDLTKAARLEPKNAEVRAQLQACQVQIQEALRKERGTLGGMFDRGSIYGGEVAPPMQEVDGES